MVTAPSAAARPSQTPASVAVEEGFRHDRHLRAEHYLPTARPHDGRLEDGRRLWNLGATRTGLGSDW
ncbi:MAG: hypothetical protein ACLPYY_06410 [Acidimicrobiales bacterium]